MNKTFTLEELARITNSKLIGNPHQIIKNVADLESATQEDVSFLSNSRYENAMQKSKAGAIFMAPTAQNFHHNSAALLLNDNPSKAFQQILEAFHDGTQELTGFEGIHYTVVIHPSAKIGKHVQIGPYTVIDKESFIGDHTFIGSGCYIGPKVSIGTHCTLHPHVTIREQCRIGNHCIIQAGAVIGSCGFGYITNKDGTHTKLNQVGNVCIEDHVEIGANTTVDRARFKSTEIKIGSKIDNLVQIAHGTCVGENNIIAAQTGIAGSTSTGKNVTMGGQVAVAGHLEISSNVMLAGRSGVSKSISNPGIYNGAPAMPIKEYNRINVLLRNIEEYVQRLKQLEKQIETQKEKK